MIHRGLVSCYIFIEKDENDYIKLRSEFLENQYDFTVNVLGENLHLFRQGMDKQIAANKCIFKFIIYFIETTLNY